MCMMVRHCVESVALISYTQTVKNGAEILITGRTRSYYLLSEGNTNTYNTIAFLFRFSNTHYHELPFAVVNISTDSSVQ